MISNKNRNKKPLNVINPPLVEFDKDAMFANLTSVSGGSSSTVTPPSTPTPPAVPSPSGAGGGIGVTTPAPAPASPVSPTTPAPSTGSGGGIGVTTPAPASPPTVPAPVCSTAPTIPTTPTPVIGGGGGIGVTTPAPSTPAAPTYYITVSGSLSFGGVVVGNITTGIMSIQNTGTGTLVISSINYPTGFSGDWSGGSIAAGATQTVTVSFNPSLVQTYSGTISVSSNATMGTNSIPCSGSGIAAITSSNLSNLGGFGGGGGGGGFCSPAPATCASVPTTNKYGWLWILAILAAFGGTYYYLGKAKEQ